jgi:hypothetical protein
MSVCDHCTARNSWDCEEYQPKNGCEDFHLDFNTLTDKQKKAIRRTLIAQEIDIDD